MISRHLAKALRAAARDFPVVTVIRGVADSS